MFVAPSSSDELGLDDVMDIELDFPTLSDSESAPASLTTRNHSVEVSLFILSNCSTSEAETSTNECL